MKHLKYSYYIADDYNVHKHAQEVMKELGISYSHCTAQSMIEQYWFWNCTNIPSELPEYISELKLEPKSQVGFGLSRSRAQEIEDVSTRKENQC